MRKTTLWQLIMIVLHCMLISSVRAEPSTLYKPHNIAVARENIARHQWARDIKAEMEANAAYALTQDRAYFQQIIPELSGWTLYTQICPACVGEGHSMGERSVFQWSIEDPETMRCKYCGTAYPHPEYPETGVLEAPRMGQTFTYYLNEEQRAHPEEDPGVHAYRFIDCPIHVSFSGMIRSYKRNWAMSQANLLARLYALTGDVRYAERTAWILDRLAEVFPNYIYTTTRGVYADLPPAETARLMGNTSGRFPPEAIRHPSIEMRRAGEDGLTGFDQGFWGAGRLSSTLNGEGSAFFILTVAYDLTREALYDDGSPVYTPEMHARIRDDLLEAGASGLMHYTSINNKCPPMRAFVGALGVLFEQPARVRWALEGFEVLLGQHFHIDGFCVETPSYSHMYLITLMYIPKILTGYTDPPGHVPDGGHRIENFDPFVHVPRYRLALESMTRMLSPDGTLPAIGDSLVGALTPPDFLEILMARYGADYALLLEESQGAPLSEKGSDHALWLRDPDIPPSVAQEPGGFLRTEYFPGWQMGVLRAGGSGDTAFYFNGTRHGNHRHFDALSIIYYAFGKELATDRGYMGGDVRNQWTESTPAHNLVAVTTKECEQTCGWSSPGFQCADFRRHSNLEMFAAWPDLELIQSSALAYNHCTEYRRTCALVPLPDGASYVVDFFRVQGGDLHSYSFHGDARISETQGLSFKQSPGKRFGWLENLRVDENPSPSWRAVWNVGGTKLQLLMDGPLDSLTLADAPGWRRNRGDELHAPPIHQILAEREGPDRRSVYTAVMCAYDGEESPVRSIRRIAPDGEEGSAFGVAVELADGIDYHLSSQDDEIRQYGPITMTGRYGMVSVDGQGKVLRASLVEGTEISFGDFRLTQPEARVERRVVSVDGRTLTLDRPLSPEQAPVGSYFLTDNGIENATTRLELLLYGVLRKTGFEIESAEDTRLTVRNYPFEGGETIVIPQVARFPVR